MSKDESNTSDVPGMIILKIKAVTRAEDILQKANSCLNITLKSFKYKLQKYIVPYKKKSKAKVNLEEALINTQIISQLQKQKAF